MSAAELKNNLIQRIQKIKDPVLLESILKIVLLEEKMHDRKVYQFTPELKRNWITSLTTSRPVII